VRGAIVLATGIGYDGGGLALDATNVYWVRAGSVLACPKTGCASGPRVLGTAVGEIDAVGVAIDATSIYWKAFDNGPTGVVTRCALTGCGSTPETLWSEPVDLNDFGGGIAVDSSNLYWANKFGGTGYHYYFGGSVLELPLVQPLPTH
jgi:hypothetical protein